MASVRPIKEVAEAQGFNISSLARRADLSYPTVHSLWHGHVVRVDLNTLAAVARVLGVRVIDLIEEDDQVEDRDDPKISAVLPTPVVAV